MELRHKNYNSMFRSTVKMPTIIIPIIDLMRIKLRTENNKYFSLKFVLETNLISDAWNIFLESKRQFSTKFKNRKSGIGNLFSAKQTITLVLWKNLEVFYRENWWT